VKFIFDQNIIIYTFAGLCGLGMLIRFIINLVYNVLVKESDNLGATKNKQLKHIKMKFETCYKLKIGVNNVDTFVDKNVLRYRFCGILLSTWECFSGQVLYLSLLLVPISALFGVIFDGGQDMILLSGTVGILASSLLMLVDKGMNLYVKKKIMRMNLLDYLENFCKVRLEQEVFHPELLEQYRQEYFKQIENNIQGDSDLEKEEPKNELDRRREARRKKEEDKRAQALKREEEQKRMEEIRKDEEKRRIEERKKIVARRREEELRRLEEEREALEARRNVKKKPESKHQIIELKHQQAEEKTTLLQSIKEDLSTQETQSDMEALMEGIEEIAAEKERTVKERKQKVAEVKENNKGVSAQEEKLIEDILKEFFA
jgi:flagellar biosynthesis GTPase FlhF